VGVDAVVHKFKILDVPFRLQLWDTAGQERFRALTRQFFAGCHGAAAARGRPAGMPGGRGAGR
jgi:hypothetical protein